MTEPAPNPWAVTGVVMLGMIMSIIDSSIVNVSVPHMMGTLGAGVSEISWVVTGYVLANVVVIPLSAWMVSVVGRSRLYGIAIAVFTIASLLCGLAPTLGLLVTARVIQGAAAGIMMPTGQAILFESFPPEKRGTSMAIFGLGIMVGPALGPTLGGYITDNYGWPWIFLINLPIGILASILVPIFLKDPAYLVRRRSARGDMVGIMLLGGGICMLQYVLEKGGDDGWFQADWVVITVATSVIMLVVFVFWELEHDNPAVDLRVFADTNFSAAALVNVAVGVGLFGGMFMLPLFLQQLIGFSATQSGFVLLPGALATAMAMPICGRLSDRSDVRILSAFGLIVFGFSMFLMSRLDGRAGFGDLLLPQILRGVGMAFCFVPLSVTAVARIPRERMGQATGLYNLTRQIGGSMGIAWLATLFDDLRAGHTAHLVGFVEPYGATTQSRLGMITGGLMARGFEPGAAKGLALKIIYGQVARASAELAFRDMFLAIVGLFAVSLPLLLLLRRRDSKAEAGKGIVVHSE